MSSGNNKHVPKPDSTSQPLANEPSSGPAPSGSRPSTSTNVNRPVPAPLNELASRQQEPTPFANPQLTPSLRQEIISNTSPTAQVHQSAAAGAGAAGSGTASSIRRKSVGGSSTSSTNTRSDPRKRPGLFQRLTGGSLRSNKDNSDVANLPLSLRPSMVDAAREPTIRIRRRPVGSSNLSAVNNAASSQTAESSNRRRSSSDPTRGQLAGSAPLRPVSTAQGGPGAHVMPQIREGTASGQALLPASRVATAASDHQSDDAIAQNDEPGAEFGDEYHRDLVDVLDTIDPEVSTLTTLTNVQNSLFVPDLGRFLSRRPVYNLTPSSTRQPTIRRTPTVIREPTITEEPSHESKKGPRKDPRRPQLTHTSTIDSTLSESRFAVLPHGRDLSGWSQAEKDELNDHVRHMLHSRRSKFKRGFKGFGQYIRRPLGFLVTLYATLITLFGLAWVLFLIGWINVGGKQLELINIIDYVLVALFAVMGDGLAPFRAWDTYNMAFITHYHRKSWKLRKKRALPKLPNKNDLPELREEEVGIEESKVGDYVVLSDEDHAKLLKHENRFCRSHTFYKPHETETHFAFPIKLLITIVVLLDCHSCLQISLGAVTWGIDHTKRPFSLTTVILCLSITCNITAGVLIAVGDRRTRKKDVVERMMRQELTEEAIQKVEKRRIEKLEEEHGAERVAAARKSLQMQRAAKQTSAQSEPTGFIDAEKHQTKGSVSGKFMGIFGVTKKGDKAPPVDKGQHRAPGTTTLEGGKEVKRSISEPMTDTGPSQDALELERERQKLAVKSKEDIEKEKAKEQRKREKEAERAREKEVARLRDADQHGHSSAGASAKSP